MKCRHCGQKLGLIGRWRSASFCSNECKEAFEDEEAKLAVQLVAEFRRTSPPPDNKKSKAAVEEELQPEVVEVRTAEGEDPAPPEAGLLPQGDAERVDWRRQRPAALPAAMTRKGKVAWKELAQQVEGRLAGGTQIAAELAQLSRAIEVDAPEESESFLRRSARPVLAPDIRPPRLRTTLPVAGLQASVRPQFHVPPRKLPEPGLPLMSPLEESAAPEWESTPLLGSMVARELSASEAMVAIPPPPAREAVPPGALWCEPQEAWEVRPEVSWTDLAWQAIRMTVVLDPYDILPQAAPSAHGVHRTAERLPHPSMGNGWPMPARPSPVAGMPSPPAYPATYSATHPAMHPATHPAMPPATPAPAGAPVWAQSFTPGVGWHSPGAGIRAGVPVAYPQRSALQPAPKGPLPSQVPVLSLADVFVPGFAPAMLEWPDIRNYPRALREEPRATIRRSFALTTVLPPPALTPGAAEVRSAPGQSVECWHAGAAPAVRTAESALLTPDSSPDIPAHRWSIGDPTPEPGLRLRIGLSPKAGRPGLRRFELRPEKTASPSSVPRRQICVWQRPGLAVRACHAEVRVGVLEAASHRTILPVEVAR